MATDSFETDRLNAEATKLIPLPSHIAALEYRKLRAETEKAELDVAQARSSRDFHRVTVMVPVLTTFIAVLGPIISVFTTARQMSLQTSLSAEQRFAESVREFASAETPLARLGAIESLKPYWSDSTYRRRITDLMLASISEIQDLNVRQAIQRQLLTTPDLETLASLADHNRLIQAYAEEVDIKLGLLRMPADSSKLEDSLYRKFDEELAWNISTLRQVIASQPNDTIAGADLGSVIFARQVWSPSNGFQRRDTVNFSNLTFIHSNFSGSELPAVHFYDTNFIDTHFDYALLTRTLFDNCVFGNSSLRYFSSYPMGMRTAWHDTTSTPMWVESQLHVTDFSSVDAMLFKDAPIFRFHLSSWRIQAMKPDRGFPRSGSGSLVYLGRGLPSPSDTIPR